MRIILSIILFLPFFISAQNPLQQLNNLMGKIWYAEGQWGDSSAFKQEVKLEYSLDSNIVKVKTYGFTNPEKTTFGLRNEGIRYYDTASKTIKFWEFDIYGNMIEGNLLIQNKNLLYQYSYYNILLTDMWEYVDDSTYNLIVGIYKDEQWEKVFLKTQFKVKSE